MSGSHRRQRTPCPARSTIWTYRPRWFPFAIAPQDASRLISPEFKAAGHPVYFFDAPYNQDGTPDYTTLKFMWNEVANLIASGKAVSAWALSTGGIAEGVCKMALGNKIGFKMDDSFPADALYLKNFGGILIEAASELPGLLAGRLYHRR